MSCDPNQVDNANMFPDWAAFEAWFLFEFTYLDKAERAALILEGITNRAASLTHTLTGSSSWFGTQGFPGWCS